MQPRPTTVPRRPGLPAAAVLCAALAATCSLSAQGAPYRATDLGVPPGQSAMAGVLAESISPDGRFVVGWSVWEPFLWQDGSGMQPLGKLPGFVNAAVLDVDSGGRAAGFCGLSSADYTATIWDAAGNPTSLHRSAWSWSKAVATNAAGSVLLAVGIPNGFYALPRALLASRGSSTLVDPAPNARASGALDLNAVGQVLLDVDGTLRIHTPGAGLSTPPNFASARLNDAGQLGASDGIHLQRWTAGVTETLGRPPRGEFRGVGAIDAFGQIGATEWIQTGTSPPSYTKIAWLYTDGLGLRRLDTLVETPPAVFGYSVAGFSDDGRIAISGSYGPDNRAILLEPRFTSTHGSGCPGGSGFAPRMIVAGTPAAGQRIVLLGAHAAAGGTGAFLVSPAAANLPLPGGCTALVDPAAAVIVPVTANAAGQADLPLDLPAAVGSGTVHAQFLSLDGGAANGAFALSNGVRINVQ